MNLPAIGYRPAKEKARKKKEIVVIIVTVLATAKTGDSIITVATQEEEPEVSINTAKLGGCRGTFGFEESGGVENNFGRRRGRNGR